MGRRLSRDRDNAAVGEVGRQPGVGPAGSDRSYAGGSDDRAGRMVNRRASLAPRPKIYFVSSRIIRRLSMRRQAGSRRCAKCQDQDCPGRHFGTRTLCA